MLYSQKTVVLNIQHMNTISDSYLNAFDSYFQYFDANTFRETRVQTQFKGKGSNRSANGISEGFKKTSYITIGLLTLKDNR